MDTPPGLEQARLLAETVKTQQHRSKEWYTARDSLAEYYDWLVLAEIKTVYKPNILRSDMFEDIMQQGRLGLLWAIDRIDPDRIEVFWVYARRCIRKQIVSVWHDNQLPVRLPRERGSMAGVMLRKGRDQQGELLPLREQYALFPHETHESVRAVYRAVQMRTVEIVDDTLTHTGDTLTPETVVERKHETATLHETVNTLTLPEQKVIKYRFGLDTGTPGVMNRASNILGMSQKEIKTCEQSARAKLAHPTRMLKIAR